jgi:hypothetical protein
VAPTSGSPPIFRSRHPDMGDGYLRQLDDVVAEGPSSSHRVAASRRDDTPSLAKTPATWCSTVRGEMYSRSRCRRCSARLVRVRARRSAGRSARPGSTASTPPAPEAPAFPILRIRLAIRRSSGRAPSRSCDGERLTQCLTIVEQRQHQRAVVHPADPFEPVRRPAPVAGEHRGVGLGKTAGEGSAEPAQGGGRRDSSTQQPACSGSAPTIETRRSRLAIGNGRPVVMARSTCSSSTGTRRCSSPVRLTSSTSSPQSVVGIVVTTPHRDLGEHRPGLHPDDGVRPAKTCPPPSRTCGGSRPSARRVASSQSAGSEFDRGHGRLETTGQRVELVLRPHTGGRAHHGQGLFGSHPVEMQLAQRRPGERCDIVLAVVRAASSAARQRLAVVDVELQSHRTDDGERTRTDRRIVVIGEAQGALGEAEGVGFACGVRRQLGHLAAGARHVRGGPGRFDQLERRRCVAPGSTAVPLEPVQVCAEAETAPDTGDVTERRWSAGCRHHRMPGIVVSPAIEALRA